MNGWTAERPAPGVVVHQPARGFRYGAEAFWLVGFALEGGAPRSAVDLGTGSGIMAWLLAARGVQTWGIDLRPEWAPGWQASLLASAVPAPRLEVGEVGGWRPPQPVELVVCNPPFYAAGSGPMPGDPWKAAARFEGGARVADFVGAAVSMLTPTGRACVVVPMAREEDVRGAVPAGWSVGRSVQVGARRVVIEIVGGAVTEQRTRCSEGDPRVAGWYTLARGVPTEGEHGCPT